MPDIPVGAQIFDLTFHPTHSTAYTALLTGEIRALTYDEQGQYLGGFVERPSKRSCRGLAISEDGAQLWAVGKSKALQWVHLQGFSEALFMSSLSVPLTLQTEN